MDGSANSLLAWKVLWLFRFTNSHRVKMICILYLCSVYLHPASKIFELTLQPLPSSLSAAQGQFYDGPFPPASIFVSGNCASTKVFFFFVPLKRERTHEFPLKYRRRILWLRMWEKRNGDTANVLVFKAPFVCA